MTQRTTEEFLKKKTTKKMIVFLITLFDYDTTYFKSFNKWVWHVITVWHVIHAHRQQPTTVAQNKLSSVLL